MGRPEWTSVRRDLERGMALNTRRRPATSLRLFRSVLARLDSEEFAAVPDADRAYVRARALVGEASCVTELDGDFVGAVGLLTRADAVARDAGLAGLRGAILGQRGLIKHRLGDLDGALADITGGLDPGLPTEDRDVMILLLNRGSLLLDRGEPVRAIPDLLRCVDLATARGDDVFVAMARHNLGYAQFLRGELPSAIASMAAAAERAPESQLGFLGMERAQVLMEAGLVADADETIALASRQLRASRMVRDLAEVELIRSRCLVGLRRFDEAAAHARSAARRFERLGNRPWALRSTVAELTARIAADRVVGVAPAVARRRAARAQDLARVAGDADLSGVTGVLAAIQLLAAEWLVTGRDLDGAREALGRVPRDLGAESLSLRLQHQAVLAQLAFAEGDRRLALRAVRRGQRMLADHREKLGSVDAVTASAVHGVRLGAVDVEAALRTRRPEAIFDAVERGRATFAGGGRVRPPTDPRAAELLGQARTELEAARSLGASATGADLDRRVSHLRDARRLQEEVRRRSWQDSGEAGTPVPTSARRVRSALAEAADGGSVVVNLVLADGAVAGVRVDAAGASHVRLAEIGEVAEAIRRARADLGVLANELIPDRMRAAARASLDRTLTRLDELLLVPLGARGDLHVAARDLLLAVPWSSLPSRRGRRTWVNSWVDLRAGEERRGTRVLSVAGPGLRVAEAEARAVADVWGGATLLRGTDATCEATTAHLASAGVVHLAAHGTHETDNPLFSSLRLADGPLFAYELDGIDLRGGVIVLSACEVGLSSVRIGGEVLGLTSVLLRLGAAAVVASVAPLRDDVAARVMPALHAHLRDGATTGDALARAVAGEPEPTPLVCFGPLAL